MGLVVIELYHYSDILVQCSTFSSCRRPNYLCSCVYCGPQVVGFGRT